MAVANPLRFLVGICLAAGLCGCGLLGVGSTVGAVVGIMAATEEAETEIVRPPDASVVLGTVAQAGIEGGRVTALAKSSGSATLWAGTYRNGIYTFDTVAGTSWTAASTGFNKNLTVSALCVDPLDPTRVLAGTGRYFAGGIWVTANGGASWTQATGLASLDVRCIAALPGSTAPSPFVAGTAAGLYRSDDGGATWTAVSSTGLYNAAISAVCVQSATTLFASTLGGGVYLYDSAAATPWTQRSAGLTDLMVTALVSHTTLPTLYAGTETAGVFTSVDSGVTWTKANTNQLPSLEVLALAVDPNSANRCWVSTALGLRYTQNGGNAWVAPGTAPADAHLVSLLSDPVDSDDVYAGGFSGGAYFCANATGGRTFAAQKTGLIATDLRSFAADATGRLYAGGGFDGANRTSSGIFGSNDAGVTWAASTFAPPGCDVRAFAPHPTANFAYVAVENGGVWFTNNGGGTWSQTWTAANDDVAALALVSSGPDTLIAGLVAGGVLRTVDGGTNWSAATGVAGTVSVWDFSFEPGSTTNVWAATSDGVYRSTDGGATWTRTAGQPQAEGAGGTLADVDPLCVQADPDTTLTVPVVYAGTELHGIFASTDGGLTFHAANQHVEGAANVRVFDFCARTTAPYGVYAATSVGLYRTRSQGGDWNPIHSDDATITDPLKRRITTGQAIALMPTDPAVLWVATGGRGVLKVTLLVP